MNAATRLALARVQVADVVRHVVRRLNAHAALAECNQAPEAASFYRCAAEIIKESAMDIADDLIRERAQYEGDRT